ncbi:hypothetical protein D3C81_1362580 [compost metagenome]
MFDRLAQAILKCDSSADDRLHLWVKKAQDVASAGFGLVHSQLGALQGLACILMLFAEQSDTYAARSVQDGCAQFIRMLDLPQSYFANAFSMARRLLSIGALAFQNKSEFVASKAGDGIALPHTTPQSVGDFN